MLGSRSDVGGVYVVMAAAMKNVEEIRTRVILEEFGVKNVSK